MTAPNTYSGTTTVAAGTVTVNGAGTLASNVIAIDGGGTLTLDNTGTNVRTPGR